MPLPTDDTVVATSQGLVNQLHAMSGPHPGFRPAHAKGILLSGTFTPSAEAQALSTAPHFHAASTPITVRFSNSTGLPELPDIDPDADPRGIAIRFNLGVVDGRRKHTDIVSHSTPFFPTRTGAEFLEFLKAAASSPPDAPHPNNVEQFLAAHPETVKFVQAPKPAPESYATQQFFSVTAFKLIDAAGTPTFIRYHVVPDAGVHTLDAEAKKAKGPNYLQEDLAARLAAGPIGFKLLAQVAEPGDVTDNATIHWPDSRTVVELGHFHVDKELPNNAAEQKRIIFDPIPRVDGVDVSDDPLLEVRAGVYLISGRERRAA